MNNQLRTINVLWRQAVKNGQTYNIRYTTDFGFNCTISSKLKAYKDDQGYYMNYDPAKAQLKVNENGYIELHISE